MWFGVAPAPSPSPRTNTRAWHPPHCTCAKHQPPPSPRRGAAPLSPSPSSPACVTPHSPRSPRRAHGAIDCPDAPGNAPKRTRPAPPPLALRSPRRREVARRNNDTDSGGRAASDPDPIRQGEVTGVIGNSEARAMTGRQPSRRLSRESNATDATGLDTVEPDRSRPTALAMPSSGEIGTADLGSTDPKPLSRRLSRRKTPSAMTDSRPLTTSFDAASLRLENMGVFGVDGAQANTYSTSFPVTLAPPPRTSSRQRSRNADRLAANADSPAPVQLPCPPTSRILPENLVGHTSSVVMVVVDDDRFIVSSSIDGSVKIWSRVTFDCLHTLYGHDDCVSCVEVGGRWLVSGSHDQTIRVYMVSSSTEFSSIHVLRGHTGHVTRVQLLPARSLPSTTMIRLLSCSDDTTLRLWDVDDGACLAVLSSHGSRVTWALAVDDRICSGAADGVVCFWESAPLLLSTQHRGEAGMTRLPQILTAASTCRAHHGAVQCLRASATTTTADVRVFSCSSDGTIHWFNGRTMEHLGLLDAVRAPIYSLIVHPTTGQLICSTRDGRLVIYADPTSPQVSKRELKVSGKWISSLQVGRGAKLACGSEEQLFVVDLDRPRIDRVMETAHGFITCVRWLDGGDSLVTCGEDNVIKVWSLR